MRPLYQHVSSRVKRRRRFEGRRAHGQEQARALARPRHEILEMFRPQ